MVFQTRLALLTLFYSCHPLAPRTGYPGAPIKEKFRKEGEKQKVSNSPSVAHKMVKAIFSNTGQDPTMKDAKLYYREDQFWMNLGHDDPETAANTYEGHVWNVKVDGKIVKTWEISETNGDEQLFTI